MRKLGHNKGLRPLVYSHGADIRRQQGLHLSLDIVHVGILEHEGLCLGRQDSLHGFNVGFGDDVLHFRDLRGSIDQDYRSRYRVGHDHADIALDGTQHTGDARRIRVLQLLDTDLFLVEETDTVTRLVLGVRHDGEDIAPDIIGQAIHEKHDLEGVRHRHVFKPEFRLHSGYAVADHDVLDPATVSKKLDELDNFPRVCCGQVDLLVEAGQVVVAD